MELESECVFSSDIDEGSAYAYEANFGKRPYGDIKKIDSWDIPDHDILLAGFPCQSLSIIGNGEEGASKLSNRKRPRKDDSIPSSKPSKKPPHIYEERGYQALKGPKEPPATTIKTT